MSGSSAARGDLALAVLFVDDEPDNLEAFSLHFGQRFAVHTARSGVEALDVMQREDIAVLVSDERMPGMSGIELLACAAARHPLTVRVIVSAYSDPERLLRAINQGHAHHYVVKPWQRTQLTALLESWLTLAERMRARAADADIGEICMRDAHRRHEKALIGESGGLKEMIELARRVGRTDSTVLIRGETGTGKELLAGLIHHASQRSGPFVCVSCAGLAESLVENELFGHEQGGYTGAHKLHKGRFEVAHRGTIFLDEVGELSAKVQATLLRVLQERTIERVGSVSPTRVDVRVVAATHRNLAGMVKDGTFREDLYFRLCVVELVMPPLRDRLGDLPELVAHLLAKHSRARGRKVTLAPDVLDHLRAYRWPGNVRELENMIERALAVTDTDVLAPRHFPVDVGERGVGPAITARASKSFDDDVEHYKQGLVMAALERCGGNQTKAAQLLGMPRRTLVAFLHRWGHQDPETGATITGSPRAARS